MLPRVLILHANGTNRDRDLAGAFKRAGAIPVVQPLTELNTTLNSWREYQILALPGGFSFADTLGAGKLLALKLRHTFNELLQHFIDNDRPVIGICNGFQALVKAGVLPGSRQTIDEEQSLVGVNEYLRTQHRRQTVNGEKEQEAPFQSHPKASLTLNTQEHFECRWVSLMPASTQCLWTKALTESIDCPVAHGEGRFLINQANYAHLVANNQIALRYIRPDNTKALGQYPFNPNGSVDDIAGVCNAKGNVLGLMPHPENHIVGYQHPAFTRGPQGRLGLALFQQGVRYVSD